MDVKEALAFMPLNEWLSTLKALYVSETNACAETLEILARQKYQVMMRKNEVRDEYYKSLQNLGLKEGAKVRVDFPEGQLESSIYGYIEEVKIIEVLGNVVLTVVLPDKEGKRLKKSDSFCQYRGSFCTGIKPEWVTILPDDFSEPPF